MSAPPGGGGAEAGADMDAGTRAAGGALGLDVDPTDEAAVCRTLFRGLVFFLGREVPREPLMLVIRALGGVAAWDGEGSPHDEAAEVITHQVRGRRYWRERERGRGRARPKEVLCSMGLSLGRGSRSGGGLRVRCGGCRLGTMAPAGRLVRWWVQFGGGCKLTMGSERNRIVASLGNLRSRFKPAPALTVDGMTAPDVRCLHCSPPCHPPRR
jgi:hypothetical protein